MMKELPANDELVGHVLVGLVLGAEAVAHLLVVALDGEAEDRPIGVHVRQRGDAPLAEHDVGDVPADQGVVQYGAIPVPNQKFRLHVPLPVDSGFSIPDLPPYCKSPQLFTLYSPAPGPRRPCQGVGAGVYL